MLAGYELVAALAIVFVGAVAMGSVGFGLGLVAAPILLLFIEPQSTVVIVNILIAILMSFVLFRTRHHFNFRHAGGLAIGGVVAVPIGVLALDTASPAVLRLTIAGVILVLAVLTLSNLSLPFSGRRFSGPVIGFITSLSVTTLSIGGPLAGIYVISRRWPPEEMRAALAFFFVLSDVVAIALYAQAGLVDKDTLANIGILTPSVIIGSVFAALAARHMDAKIFRYAAATLIIVGGTVLLSREIARL